MHGPGTGRRRTTADRRPVHDPASTRPRQPGRLPGRLVRLLAAAGATAALGLAAGASAPRALDAEPARLALTAPARAALTAPARPALTAQARAALAGAHRALGTRVLPAMTAAGSDAPAAAAYWTRRRMAAARPADLATVSAGVRQTRASGLDAYLHRIAPGRGASTLTVPGTPWTAGGLVARTTGKVFFSLGPDDYVCSGSAVDAPDRSTVLTAGHCVVDPETGTAATNWIFVPGYRDGVAPYGIFAGTHLAPTDGWRTSQDFDVDVAFADVARNAAGQRLEDAVGAQPLGFGAARGQAVSAFGYPAAAPWTGERLVHCAGVVRPDPTASPSGDQGLACTMTGGSSGGPWFAAFDRRTGRGTVTSLTSFSYSDAPGVLYGPYLGDVARALYTSVASTPGL
jgi:hypothetical protein